MAARRNLDGGTAARSALRLRVDAVAGSMIIAQMGLDHRFGHPCYAATGIR